MSKYAPDKVPIPAGGSLEGLLMEDFGVEAGPVHDNGALVRPDLRHLGQLRVPLQRGQARTLHICRYSQRRWALDPMVQYQ